ncbi:hypothetical protein GOODEAATRI_031294 [Goodea atripinnis]|uniref:Transposase n=1 Tax=Goodea atripinnis TaxID=208336 RepID=A0ABV0NF57_9TELE
MQKQPLDVDYLRFVVNHKILLFRSLRNHVQMPPDIVHGLTVLTTLVNEENAQDFNPSQLPLSQGELGRPKYVVPSQQLQTFTKMSFSVSKIAAILGICPRTVKRRLHDYGMSTKQCYSRLTDEEMDTLVRSIKAKTPNIGYWMTKGILQSMSHHVHGTEFLHQCIVSTLLVWSKEWQDLVVLPEELIQFQVLFTWFI